MTPPLIQIPVASADVGGQEAEYVQDAVRSTWISSSGPYLARFERRFAELCGVRHCIAVSNGTVAIHLALLALGVKPGDEVIVPSLTYIATANAVRYCGAEPVFVDVSERDWCLDPGLLEAAIGPRVRGIVAVDLYGHAADLDRIRAVADRHGLWVVEDAAEAHLGTYKGRVTGSLARIGTFSFYGNKILTCGEGGAVTLDDDALEALARQLRGQGMDPNRRYFFPIVGYNYRLTNVAAAMLCAQLERADAILARRAALVARYRERLEAVPGLGFQPVAPDVTLAPWLMNVVVDEAAFGRSRDALAVHLAQAGIETRPFFIPVHRLPPYAAQSAARGEHLPVTDRLAREGLNLPLFNTLGDEGVDRVAEAIRSARR